ncbi:MAG: acetoin dehydrogenase dihydrolipoyllysine-residue acetyltransferase subunit [Roseiarcus sp.]|jgi:pyruvate dehydrogenase E2 component (dihydrolipoamide acetyltransferase)
MASEVILPRVDMDMATGKMGRWFVAEGERVREGQLLFEIETDKAAMEVEAPASGVLRGVRARVGDVLPVGAVVGWIVGEDEAFDPDLQALAGELRALLGSSAALAERASTPSADARGRATPLARRLARERGLDLADVAGSGPNGRVQALDVTLYERPARAEPSSGAAQGARLNRLWLQKGEGAPLVFIHGFGADLNGWRPLLAHLPAPRPAFALDLPGHGGSPLAGDSSFAALVGAVRAALAGEGIRAAHLVGHSLGGAVAAALAAERMGGESGFRALSLMLIAPAGLGPEVNSAFLAGFLRARSEASLTPWMRLLAADPVSLGAALVKTTLRQREGGALVEAQTRLAESLFPDGVQAFGIRHWLADPATPTKIVVGAEDQIIPPRQSEGLSGLIAIHRFAGVGHMPHLEARREVARLVEELAKAGG